MGSIAREGDAAAAPPADGLAVVDIVAEDFGFVGGLDEGLDGFKPALEEVEQFLLAAFCGVLASWWGFPAGESVDFVFRRVDVEDLAPAFSLLQDAGDNGGMGESWHGTPRCVARIA